MRIGSIDCSNEVIYQVFPRIYSKKGTLKEVTNDLKRIKDLGVTILYLLPIYPIGEKERKGTYGSPYAIKDYKAVSPDLGTIDDFKTLSEQAHKLNLKVMLDMVFNHCAPDNQLTSIHPEYFMHKDGVISRKVEDWSDVVDFNYNNPETENYLLSVLDFWHKLGCDGYRFDVSSFVPLSLYKRAKEEIDNDLIFLGEAIDESFRNSMIKQGYYASNESEEFTVLDCLYSYSYYFDFKDLIKNPTKENFTKLIEKLNIEHNSTNQKIFFLENHDQERIASYTDKVLRSNLVALLFFAHGIPFIYAGQEYEDNNTPSLFEKSIIKRTGEDETYLDYKFLINQRKNEYNDQYLLKVNIYEEDSVLYYEKVYANKSYLGVFNFSGVTKEYKTESYKKVKYGRELNVTSGKLPRIFKK
jgi:glycosidase